MIPSYLRLTTLLGHSSPPPPPTTHCPPALLEPPTHSRGASVAVVVQAARLTPFQTWCTKPVWWSHGEGREGLQCSTSVGHNCTKRGSLGGPLVDQLGHHPPRPPVEAPQTWLPSWSSRAVSQDHCRESNEISQPLRKGPCSEHLC